MNTIEFAIQDGVPYAIDFLNPAPDFERDRITPHYFDMVIEKMSTLVIDRALNGRAHAVVAALGGDGRAVGTARRLRSRAGCGRIGVEQRIPIDAWHALRARASGGRGASCAGAGRRACASARLTFGGRLLCPFLRPFFLDPADEARVDARGRDALARSASASPQRPRRTTALMLEQLGLSEAETRLARIDPGYDVASTAARADAFLLPDSLQFAEYNAEVAGRARLQPAARGAVRRRAA